MRYYSLLLNSRHYVLEPITDLWIEALCILLNVFCCDLLQHSLLLLQYHVTITNPLQQQYSYHALW